MHLVVCVKLNEKCSMVHEGLIDTSVVDNTPKIDQIKRGKLSTKMSTVRKLIL